MSLEASTVEGNALRVMAQDRAAATPLPGPLADAFCKDAIDVGPFKVRKIVARDFKIWTQLDSPILKSMLELEKPEGVREVVAVTDEEEWEICYQFLNHPKTVQDTLNKGKQAFREAAESSIGDNPDIGPGNIRLIMAAVNQQIANHYKTVLSHAAKMKESGDVRFFQDGAKAPETA